MIHVQISQPVHKIVVLSFDSNKGNEDIALRTITTLISAALILSVQSAVAKPSLDSAAAARREGRRLFLESSCIKCHSINGKRDTVGPPLDGIGQRRSADYIASKIRDPQTHPNLKLPKHQRPKVTSKMVQADLFEDQIQKLTQYLISLESVKKPQDSATTRP